MKCICGNLYSEASLPRILIECGHSLCEECIRNLLKLKEKKCPYCQKEFACQNLDKFPVNQLIFTNVQQMCPVHQRKIEAFCKKDYTLLCLLCITKEEHAQHSPVDLQEAGKQERKFVLEVLAKSSSQDQYALDYRNAIQKMQSNVLSSFQSTMQEIDKFYKEIYSIIEKQKQQLISKYQLELNKQQEEIYKLEQALKSKVQLMLEFTHEVCNLKNEDDFDLTCKSKKRHQLVQKLNAQLPDFTKNVLYLNKGIFSKIN